MFAWSAEKCRFECKVIRHAHQELPRSTAKCTERRTRHSALICTVSGRCGEIGLEHWSVQNRACTNILSKDISVLAHGDDFATLATRTQIAEFKEDLSKHLLVKQIATLCPRQQLFTSVRHDFRFVCCGGLCRRLEKRQNVLRSKLIRDMQRC